MGYFGSILMCPTASNDAEYRVWGKSVSNFFASSSWVTESTVTNAINWNTATKSATAFVSNGFEVWKMNDALATGSLCNVYVRIDYAGGFNPTTANYNHNAYYITVGTSCSPLGIIGSANGGRVNWLAGTGNTTNAAVPTPSTVNYVNYASGDPSRIGILFLGRFAGDSSFLGANDYSLHSYFNIERLKDANGNDTANGIHICGYPGIDNVGGTTGQGKNYCWNILYTGSSYGPSGVAGAETRYQSVVSSTSNYDFRIGAGLHVPIVGYALPPVLGSVALNTNDASYFSTVTVPINGVNHTYLSLKATGAAGVYFLANILRTDVVREYLAMRYE